MKTVALFAFLSLLACAAGDAADACAGGDDSCESGNDELSMLSLNIAKHQTVPDLPTHAPDQTDTEPEESHSADSSQGTVSNIDGDAAGLLERDSDKLSEVEEHIAHVLSKANVTMIKRFLRARPSQATNSNPQSSTLKYANKYFNNRINLCGGSFTGTDSCSLGECEMMVVIYSTMATTCHSSGWWYGNGHLCRCLSSSASGFNYWDSGSGNNIYQLR